MADNITLPATGSGTATPVVATDDIASVHYQYVKLVDGTADSVAKIAGDATNGLDVDVTRLPALVAGTANIGDVDVLTMPGTVTEDAASAGGETSILIAGVRNDNAAGKAGTDGDFCNLATDAAGRLGITDLTGSITVDAPTGTPVAVQIGNGTLTAGVIDETGASAVDALAVGGGTAHDAVDSGNPIKIGLRAANALPTAVANSDRANGISDLWGRQLISHIDPAMQVTKSFNATTAQTGADVWDPAAGKKIAVTSVVVSTYGTTAGRILLWFGDNTDTAYTAGTDQLLLAFSAAPSSTSKPAIVYCPATPVFCITADFELHITTDANISVDVVVTGYEW